MKQIKHTLIIMLLSLIYINIIEEINSANLNSLYYTNSELSNLETETKAKAKSKKAVTKKTKGNPKKNPSKKMQKRKKMHNQPQKTSYWITLPSCQRK